MPGKTRRAEAALTTASEETADGMSPSAPAERLQRKLSGMTEEGKTRL